nr:immunoglobulin heavy chain junction region [Macaca mulatta]
CTKGSLVVSEDGTEEAFDYW